MDDYNAIREWNDKMIAAMALSEDFYCSGGYRIPAEDIKFPKPGIWAWMLRLINNHNGWETRNLYKELIDAIEKAKIEKL